MLKKLIGMLLAASLATAALPIAAAHALSGCYLTGHGGVANATTESSLAGFDDGRGITSALLGAVLGCDAAFDKAFAGVWAEGDLYRMSDGSAVTPGVGGAALDKSAAIGARLGWMLTPYTGAYVKGGWGWTWTHDVTAGGSSFGVPTRDGPVAGFGIQTKLVKNLDLDVSYLGWFNQDDSVDLGGSTLNLKDRVDTVRIGLVFRFGASEQLKADDLFKAPELTPQASKHKPLK